MWLFERITRALRGAPTERQTAPLRRKRLFGGVDRLSAKLDGRAATIRRLIAEVNLLRDEPEEEEPK